MQANKINHLQGSADWLAFRRGKLSASKSSIILNLSEYQTPYQLWEEETGLREPKISAPHMQRGLDIEDSARDWFFKHMGVEVFPAVVQHPEFPEFIASLDGLSGNGTVILEIKNNRKELHELAKQDKVCDMHYAQIQHQLFVTDLNECFYLSYREDDPILISVKRDIVFIVDMVQKELEFKRKVDDLIPPELTEKDYEDLSSDNVLSDYVSQYNDDIRTIKFLQDRADRFKKDIRERIGDKNAKGNGWKMTKYKVSGRVDYDAILSQLLPDVELSQFRKPDSYAYRITVG